MFDPFVEEQITIKMPQGRKLAPHTAPIHLMRKELLQKLADVVAPRGQKKPFLTLQKLGELEYVRRISADRVRRQPLLDAQVVEKARKHSRIGFGSHGEERVSMPVIGHN